MHDVSIDTSRTVNRIFHIFSDTEEIYFQLTDGIYTDIMKCFEKPEHSQTPKTLQSHNMLQHLKGCELAKWNPCLNQF